MRYSGGGFCNSIETDCETEGARACPQIHSYNLPPRFTPDFTLNLVNAARCTSHENAYFRGVIVILSVSAKYSCGFPDPQVLPIIVVDKYLDYFTTIMEDRLW